MERIGVFIVGYIFGATIIHYFCANFITRIPLLDVHALTIRNFLCIIWLILMIVITFFAK